MHLYVNIRICIAVYVYNISKHRFNFPINVEMDPRHSVPVLASQTFCPAFLSRENVLCPFVTLFCPSVVLSREMPFCPANKRGQTATGKGRGRGRGSTTAEEIELETDDDHPCQSSIASSTEILYPAPSLQPQRGCLLHVF